MAHADSASGAAPVGGPAFAGDMSADVVVVGAGPAGASAAYHLAAQGLDVILAEKQELGRDKACGDGLTPSAVRELVRMGVDISDWRRNEGLRVIGGGRRLHIPWPEQVSLPSYGLARRRSDLDRDLAEHAANAGARLLTGVTVTGPVTNTAGRVVGVAARPTARFTYPGISSPTRLRAPVVIDAGGVSARLATAMGRDKNGRRPLGVAVRAYFRSPRAEVWSVGDGLVNVGLGSVSSHPAAARVDYRAVFARWLASAPASWGFTPDNQVGPLASSALPMAFNRKPHYADGLMLVGDAGGMVSPFNGEGIAQALMSGRLAAEAAAQAAARSTAAGRERALAQYPAALEAEMGGYYTLGRIFVALIEHPEVMRACIRYGLGRKRLMKLVSKLLSDGWERRGGDATDHLIQLLTRMVPAA